MKYFECVILGAGITGLSLAYQLVKRKLVSANQILIIETEDSIGLHTSGRNSGVIHAGLYYKPGSLKAQVCVAGARRLLEWADNRKLKVNRCGKLIIAQDKYLEEQLQTLYERGTQNGALVEFVTSKQCEALAPSACRVGYRALWSPATSVINPLDVVTTLAKELKELGVFFSFGCSSCRYEYHSLLLAGDYIYFGCLYNCAGAYSVEIAQKFDVASDYRVIPFKGNYWEIKQPRRFDLPCNVYPVPDLDLPFLGIHFTPSAVPNKAIYIGPTATFAFGKKNYHGIEGFDAFQSAINATILAVEYLSGKSYFRSYVHKQSYLWFERFVVREAKKLVPSITTEDIVPSKKVGIRAQVFNLSSRKLSDDFILETQGRTAHVVNAVSPAFTSSFALADLIINQSGFFDKT